MARDEIRRRLRQRDLRAVRRQALGQIRLQRGDRAARGVRLVGGRVEPDELLKERDELGRAAGDVRADALLRPGHAVTAPAKSAWTAAQRRIAASSMNSPGPCETSSRPPP